MPSAVLEPKYLILAAFLLSVAYVHLRGRVRFSFVRQLFNHSSLMAPYNALIYLFSAVPSKPLLDEREFPDLRPLSANWQTMREEALKLNDEGYIRAALNNNDIGFNSFFKRGWKRFYLKWYDQPLASAEALCPRTVALLKQVPAVKGAMFALLGPRTYLNPHRDPFAGSLRYHLGLVTANSDACFIEVDGARYWWKDGEAVLFDETYIHSVENNTDVTRIILLCDIERPLHTRVMQAVNRWVSRNVVAASSTQNVESEPVGALNRFYSHVYHPIASCVSGAARKLKQRNRPLYRTLQYGLVLGALYLIFASPKNLRRALRARSRDQLRLAIFQPQTCALHCSCNCRALPVFRMIRTQSGGLRCALCALLLKSCVPRVEPSSRIGSGDAPSAAILHGDCAHRDAIDRAGRNAELAAGADSCDDRMHELRCADNRIDRTCLYAQRAADALLLVYDRDGRRCSRAALGIEWFRSHVDQCCELRDELIATGCAPIDVCRTRCDRFRVGTTPCVTALAALGLRQEVVNVVGNGPS